MKLVVLYKKPDDVAAFDAAYTEHIKLVEKVPGISELRLTRMARTLVGDGYYLMAEMIFPDKATFKTAMRSPEMAATGKDVERFAAGLMTMMMGNEVDG